VARARPDGVVIDGSEFSGGATLIAALRRRLGARVAILVSDQFDVSQLLKTAGPGARGVYVATTEALPERTSLTPAGARFVASFGTAARERFTVNSAAAAEVVLKAIARSDGSRASVLSSLRSLHVEDGILGSFAFDRYGDMTPAAVTILRVTGDTPLDARLPPSLEGSEVDRVIVVPASLAG
jgi:ABC-type branched-subunit amino acid transport system substrate-binding protein